MMYSEFIELSNFTEKYISFAEYTTFIEPIYVSFMTNSVSTTRPTVTTLLLRALTSRSMR